MATIKSRLLRNPYLSMLATAWRYAHGEKRKYVAVYSMFVMSNLMTAMEPIIWGLFINELQKNGVDALRYTWMYVGAYLFIRLADWSFHGPARIMERELAFNLSRNFLQEMYHKALHLPVKWHQDHHSGATINRIRKAYEALKEFFQDGFMYAHALAKFFFSFAAMLYFAPIFGFVALLLGICVVIIILKFDKPYIKTLEEVNEGEHVVSSTLFDSLSNIITVITLRLQKRMESGLLQKVSNIFPPFRRNIRINEWKWFVVEGICLALIYAVILLGYVYQNWKPGEVFLIGGLVMLIGYVERFTSVFQNIAWQYTMIVKYNTDVKTAQSIIDAYAEHHLPEEVAVLPNNWKTIEVNHLNFTHNEVWNGAQTTQGLHEVAIRIGRGQRIAFIGESGSGKSTLLALLRGLYPSEQGIEIIVDDAKYNSLDVINSHVTLFPQEPEIFENTIEYNITLGLPFGEAEVQQVCETAHFSEVITQLPKGLQSNIQEKGVNLSGGQKQRLALSRGILAARDSHIVLLDEPTSSVDPKTELKIYEKIFREFADKAIISSLHRLHLLTHFDYIYVLENGRIVDEGTFEHLRAFSPIFQELWRHQEETLRV
ncbi:MAG: ABC transporter ATP-binding protein [Saprospiraceae bacterium]|nr:ABC transporter ATP-binding protein [Saprospiraceae bacterium]